MSVRVGIALLYAHWEGWIKTQADYYLTYVSQKKLTNRQLSNNFLALAMRSHLVKAQAASGIGPHLELVEFVRCQMDAPAKLGTTGHISTQSNLSSTVLKEIVGRLGLDYEPYELSENLIDQGLVRTRNEIAHGEHVTPTLQEFESVHHEIVRMLSAFTTDLLNAAAMESYRSRNAA